MQAFFSVFFSPPSWEPCSSSLKLSSPSKGFSSSYSAVSSLFCFPLMVLDFALAVAFLVPCNAVPTSFLRRWTRSFDIGGSARSARSDALTCSGVIGKVGRSGSSGSKTGVSGGTSRGASFVVFSGRTSWKRFFCKLSNCSFCFTCQY